MEPLTTGGRDTDREALELCFLVEYALHIFSLDFSLPHSHQYNPEGSAPQASSEHACLANKPLSIRL
jgi:hypothetical protein